jgi:hypothetical protein
MGLRGWLRAPVLTPLQIELAKNGDAACRVGYAEFPATFLIEKFALRI